MFRLLHSLEYKITRHFLILSGILFRWGMHPNGWWRSDLGYKFDNSLSNKIISVLQKEECKTVIDVGCGRGDYLKELRFAGFVVFGLDGNMKTNEITGGLASRADLTYPLSPLPQKVFGGLKVADWCICLGVGHFIPELAVFQFVENLTKVHSHGLILSWDIPGTYTPGSCNEKTPEEIKKLFLDDFNFDFDLNLTFELRNSASIPQHSNSIYVFRKKYI